MVKYTFVVYHRELDNFLRHLQELGVVDVSKRGTVPGEDELQQMQLISRYDSAYSLLSTIAKEKGVEHITAACCNVDELLKEVELLRDEKDAQLQLKDKVKLESESIAPWGNFSVEALKRLTDSGMRILFYTCAPKAYNPEWENDVDIFKIEETPVMLYFVVVQKPEDEFHTLDDAQEQKMPAFSVQDKQKELDATAARVEQIDARLKELVVLREALLPAKAAQLNDLQLKAANNNVLHEAEGALAILEGYCPAEDEQNLINFLDAEQQVYFAEDVTVGDDPPILLKNNGFAKLFEPITGLFALPKYSELDPTPLFAPFFMLFFGFCFGDAAYGLILILACLLLMRKVKPDFRPFCKLGMWLGAGTVIFGTIGGSFMGFALVDIPTLKKVHKYIISQDGMMILSLAVGAVQILYGMGIKAVNIARQQGIKYALAQIASILLLICLAAYLGLPKLEVTLSAAVSYSLQGVIVLAALVFFFYNTPGKNPLVNFGSGIWGTYNLVTGVLGDLLSYIRLFALGLTGGILGGVFNSLAFSVYGDKFSILGFVSMFLIFIFGHTLNILLSLLGSLVHPLRLTFVEFFKNAGFEGGGRAYNPLKFQKIK
ncbi:MAG: ATPase [Prevotellaceae bacterium]|nr:ATPase [Prevotellaceae bacterium]